MSWEEDYRRYSKCPCGKGYIVSKSSSNDWGKTRSYTFSNCKECCENYRDIVFVGEDRKWMEWYIENYFKE